MKSFYKEWLDKLNAENNEAVRSVQQPSRTVSQQSTSIPILSSPIASTSKSVDKEKTSPITSQPIAFTSKTFDK